MVSCKVTFSETSSSSKIKPLQSRKGILKKKKVMSNAIVIAKKLPRSVTESEKRAMERAEELNAKLPAGSTSLVKRMLPSHVSGGFWLGLPSLFCKGHMPKQDEIVTLVDENDKEFETVYLKEKNGLSGGWRGFSIAHNLVPGDVLVFELLRDWNIKVHIVRAKELTEIDGAISLLTLHPHSAKRQNAKNHIQQKAEKHSKSRIKKKVITHLENHVKQDVIMLLENHVDQEVIMEQSSEKSDELGCESVDKITLSDPIDFKDVKCIDDFKIVVEGLNITSILPSKIRFKYYNLCCNQKSFLHQNLLEGLNLKLTVGVISETVNIADSIQDCRLTSDNCKTDLLVWDKTLKGFSKLGVEVGFIRERIHKLLELLTREESKEVTIVSKLADKETAEAEMKSIKKVIKNLGHEIESLKDGTVMAKRVC